MPTSANIVVVPCKRTQLVGPNNVACCWPTMLRPFAWALTSGFQLPEEPRLGVKSYFSNISPTIRISYGVHNLTTSTVLVSIVFKNSVLIIYCMFTDEKTLGNSVIINIDFRSMIVGSARLTWPRRYKRPGWNTCKFIFLLFF